MCGLGNFFLLLIILFVMSPVFIAFSYAVGRRAAKKIETKNQSRHVRAVSLCAGVSAGVVFFGFLTVCTSIIFLLTPDHSRERFEEERKAAANERAASFWSEFEQFEQKLYAAKSDSDPSIGQLKKLIAKQNWVVYNVLKLGPTHSDGRRELGLSADAPYQNIPEKLKSHWYFGESFSLPSKLSDRRLIVAGDSCPETADPDDYRVMAKRAGNRVDVTVYADDSVKEKLRAFDVGSSVEQFALDSLGGEAYHRYLGKITVYPRDKEPKDLSLGYDLQKAFVAQLSEEQRGELSSVVTKSPCVLKIPHEDPKSIFIRWEFSPHLKVNETNHLI